MQLQSPHEHQASKAEAICSDMESWNECDLYGHDDQSPECRHNLIWVNKTQANVSLVHGNTLSWTCNGEE